MRTANYISRNSFEMSGRIVKDAQSNESRSYARFSLAHNFGKGMEPLFVDVVMFDKNGKKAVNIPFELLKKGTPVVVSGYMRPNVYKAEDGRTYRRVDYVVLSVEAIQAEPEAEGEGEEEPAPAPAIQPAPAEEEPVKKASRKGSKKAAK